MSDASTGRPRRGRSTRLTLAAALAAAALGTTATAARAVNVQIVNDSGRSPQNVYLMLDGGSSSDGQLVNDVPVPLSALTNSSFALGTIAAGRLYVSYGAPVNNAEPPMSTTRYDKIEFTNPGVANLTAVDFFAIPFDMQSLDASGATIGDALTYRCHTSTLLPQLQAVAPSAEVTSGGQFVRVLSPQLSPTSYGSMSSYISSLAGQTIQVNDAYYGTPYQTLSYSGTFAADGSITLTGKITTPSTSTTVTGSSMHIDGSTLASGIYTGNGPYTVDGSPQNIGFNNQYSVIYRDIVAGFSLGYWGGRYGNDSASWIGQPDFAAARLQPSPFLTYNQYSATIAQYSGAYGYSFQDVGPTAVTVPLDSSVATLQLTIDSDQGPNTPGCVGASTPSAPPAPPAPAPPATTTTSTATATVTATSTATATATITATATATVTATAMPAPVTPAPTSPPAPTRTARGRVAVAIDSNLLRLDSRGRALVALSCAGDPCKGSLTLVSFYYERVGPPRHTRRGESRGARLVRRALAVSRTEFAIDEGRSRWIWVSITPAGRRQLAAARDHRLGVLAQAWVGPRRAPTVAGQRGLTLQSYAPPRRSRQPRRRH